MKISSRFFYGLMILITIGGCDVDLFDPYEPGMADRLAAYNNASPHVSTSTPGLFIDFSAGINNAFRSSVVKDLLSECFNALLTDKFEVYRLGSNEITPLPVTNTTQLGQEISNQANYKDIWAPIEKTVERITDANNDALLITDFEEWIDKTEVTGTAYLKLPFLKWLGKGHSIHFFIVDYKEGKVDKHVYFTVFNSTGDLLSKLAPRLAATSLRYDLSANAYNISTKYPEHEAGGIYNNEKNIMDVKQGEYIRGLNYEYYPVGLDWKTIEELHKEDTSAFKYLFRNLFIDLSNQDSYSFERFEVDAFNVTRDFENYAKADYVLHHPPAITKGDDGQNRISDLVKDPLVRECYNEDGTVKDACKYRPEALKALPDYFRISQSLFDDTKKRDEKQVELGIVFASSFKPAEGTFLKLNIVLTSAVPNLKNPSLEKFKWINARGIPNTALYESVKNTLLELKPENNVVYTYYIKTSQN